MSRLSPAEVRLIVQRGSAGRAVYFLGWLGLAVLLADGAARRVRAVMRAGRRGLGRAFGLVGRWLPGWLGLAVLGFDGAVRLRRAVVRGVAGWLGRARGPVKGDRWPTERAKPASTDTRQVNDQARRGGAGWRVAGGWVTGVCAAAGAGVLVSALAAPAPRPPQPQPQAMPSQYGPGAGTGLTRAEPTKIEIPAIGVAASLLSLGVDDKDELAVPPLDRAELASWYNLGPSPGEAGSAIIVGHVDSSKTGPAVFFNLGKLKPGDLITVMRRDGTRPAFKVDSVQTFLKTSFPSRLVYEGKQATLRVITCGGEFDKKTRNYQSNVVVFASLET